MNANQRTRLVGLLTLSLVTWSLVVSVTRAQEAATDSKASAAERGDMPFKEQTIYIPYSKLRDVFETEGRGVYLPYEKFQELWKAAQDKQQPAPTNTPPVKVLISEVNNVATIGRDVVQVKAVAKIDVIGTGWHTIPLKLADAAITSATIGGDPAKIVHDPKTGYNLILERKKGDAEQVELTLEYAKKFDKTPGRNSVSFQAPQSPVSRWQVRIDEAGVKIDIFPLIAASDVPNANAKQARSEIQAFVGAAESVRIDWTPRAEGATGLEVLANAQADQQMFIDENATRTRTAIVYTISRAELKGLTIDVPEGHRVVSVSDPNIRGWKVEKQKDGVQRIVADLFEPAGRAQSVVVELEQFAAEGSHQDIVVPVVAAVGVGRQQGVLVVKVADGLRAEAAKRTGLLQLDRRELPPLLQRDEWNFAYRYATVPYELTLSVEKVQPRITVDSLVEANLQAERLTLDVQAVYTIERAGLFRLEWAIPTGYSVHHVLGNAKGTEAVDVATFRVEGDAKDKLIVNLSRKAIGRVGLTIQLVKTLEEPDLLTPTGKKVTLPLVVPRVVEGTVERATGRLVIHKPESLRVNPEHEENLRAVNAAEALNGMFPVVAGNPAMVYMFAEGSAKVELVAERRKPQTIVRQTLAVRVEPGVVKYQDTFRYSILYSGVKSLRIDLPSAIVPLVHNDTPGIREAVIAPAPDDLAEGYTAWSLGGESEFLGNVMIKLSWEAPLDKLEIGTSVDLTVPELRPRGVDRAEGQIILAKAEAIDVQEGEKLKGLRPIDPQYDVWQGTAVADAARAFEFHEDAWLLPFKATRYKLQEVKHTSIELAVVRMVVTRGDETAVQALYRMHGASQRLSVKLPDGAKFDTEPLRVNGRNVTLETSGKNDEYFIPLAGQDPDRPFHLELRYTLAAQGSHFDLPVFLDEPAVQQVYLCVYLPQERAIRRMSGPWSDEMQWTMQPAGWRGYGMVPTPIVGNRPMNGDAELVQRVAAGTGFDGSRVDTFPRDGRLYVFSTLRPEPPPNGSLVLNTVDRNVLSWGVLLVLVVGGMALLTRRTAERALAVGGLIVLLIVLRIFLPLLSYEIFNMTLALGMVVVLVLWCVWFFVRRRPQPVPAMATPMPPVTEGGESHE